MNISRRRSRRVRGTAVRGGLFLLFATVMCLAPRGTAFGVLLNFRATIEQAQETPPTGSPSVWTGTFQLDTTTAMVTFNITQTGPPLLAPEIAAHVHVAPIGVPGPIVFPLPPGSPKVGVYGPLTAAQIDDMRFGQHYANIHSTLSPAGEIRGQILPIGLLPLDHYQCYKLKKDVITFPPTVLAVDQFASSTPEIKKAFLWCNPVDKNSEGIRNDIDHLLCYKIKAPNLVPAPHVQSVNQFGTQTLFAKKPFVLCVPGNKTIIP